jgi:hypothetical protein
VPATIGRGGGAGVVGVHFRPAAAAVWGAGGGHRMASGVDDARPAHSGPGPCAVAPQAPAALSPHTRAVSSAQPSSLGRAPVSSAAPCSGRVPPHRPPERASSSPGPSPAAAARRTAPPTLRPTAAHDAGRTCQLRRMCRLSARGARVSWAQPPHAQPPHAHPSA